MTPKGYSKWTVIDDQDYEWPWATKDPMTGSEVKEMATDLLAQMGLKMAKMHPGLPEDMY